MCKLIEAIDFFQYQNEINALLQEIQNIAFQLDDGFSLKRR